MSTIDFVVRDSAGNIQRGSVGEGGTGIYDALYVAADEFS